MWSKIPPNHSVRLASKKLLLQTVSFAAVAEDGGLSLQTLTTKQTDVPDAE